MQIILNGKPATYATSLTVQALLDLHELTGERVAVECNGVILDRDAFTNHTLSDGDVLEVVRFVGGG